MSDDRRLVLIRHGKSDWSVDVSDRARPLAPRGRRQAPSSGDWLARHLPELDAVVVSPAERARATWELVAAQLRHPPDPATDERIYAFAGEDLLPVVRGLDPGHRTVVMVGHNPALEQLLTLLTAAHREMPTSCLAVVEWAGAWDDAGRVHAVLTAYGRPPAEPTTD